jgi:hypothetical protein
MIANRVRLPGVLAACLVAASPGLARAGAPAKAAAASPREALELGRPASLAASVVAIERATKTKGVRLHGRSASVPVAEGRSFEVDARTAGRLLAGSHDSFRKAGLFLFRHERSFGVGDDKDQVAVLATTDWRVVVRRMGTAGAVRGVTSERIVEWLEALHAEEPFELTEVGIDYVAGRFESSPKDPSGVAKRIAEFAPDLVRGHKDPIAGLADLIGREKMLYLIWD